MPRTLAQNAQYIAETIKPAIKQAIEDKGVTVPSTDSFLDYADRIGEIEGGGSGYQLKDLPSGSISTVNDAAPLPLNALKVSVEAWQEGSGDPSPSNVRPIHGWSEAEININNYPSGYYGMIIHQAISDPTQRIEYTGINANYTPMSQSNGVTSYGDWGSMPTLTLNKPAMIRTDGTFDYWLDETDYNKKADGTASDVDNLNYDGNALAYFPALWMKVIESGTDLEVRFAYNPIDSDYYEVCPSGSEGVWLPMFYGCPDSNGYMRSVANTNCLGGRTYINTTDAQETAIKKNGNDYYFLGGKLLDCITLLEMMWFKTTNSDDTGRGNQDGYNASAADGRYGTKSNPIVGGGQFYLTNDGKTANKILHCLPLATYDVWLRNPYLIVDNGTYKVSKDYSYDTSGATLTNTGLTIPSQGYIKELVYVNGYGLLPKTTGGSTTTYYCDYLWVNASIVSVPFSLGDCSNDRPAGFRAAACGLTAGASSWTIGCALFLKQSKSNTYNHAFTDSQGNPLTVYGGEWNVVDGELKVTDGYIASYNGETLPSTWISDRDVYASGTTPTTGAEVVYKLATPQTIPQQAESIRMLEGVNNLYADCGEVVSGEYFSGSAKGYVDGIKYAGEGDGGIASYTNVKSADELLGASAITFEVYARIDSYVSKTSGAYARLMEFGNSQQTGRLGFIGLASDNDNNVCYWDDTADVASGIDTWTLGDTHLVSIVKTTSGVLKIYVDGVLKYTGSSTLTITTSIIDFVAMRGIYAQPTNTGRQLNGEVFAWRVYGKELSAANIAQNLTADRSLYSR